MATLSLHGKEFQTQGELPQVGSKAPNFNLTSTELADKSLNDFHGKNVLLNIFPSIDTGTCAASVRRFNKEASKLNDTVVLCISKDLPFAQTRFCGAEGIENVYCLSEIRDSSFSDNYKVKISDGPLKGLLSRAVIAINKEGEVVYTEQVKELSDEPNYEAAMKSLSN